MSRCPSTWLLGLLMAAVTTGLWGCSEGEDIPLLAPGGGMEWPADPAWIPLSPLAKRTVDRAGGLWRHPG